MTIILGSGSRGRKMVLENIGLPFDVMSADIDEKSIRSDDPKKLTLALAHAKAEALIPRIARSALLITADGVVLCNGEMREKPIDEREATTFLKSYNRYPADVITSVLVTNIANGRKAEGTDIARIWFHSISDAVIRAYIATRDPFEHSGGFDHMHQILAPYVKRIKGEKESITGLPRSLTISLIRKVVY